MILVFKVGARVFLEWDGRISALLRAVVHQTILANIKVAAAGAAAPLIAQPL
jgi:hypothetical protein